MKLNIYENKKIIKTYEAETYDLLYGTVTDIAKVLDLDKLQNGSDEEIMNLILNLLKTGLDNINWLLKDIFDGLSDDELRKTKVNEIVKVLLDVVTYTFNQIGGSKN